MAAINFTPDSPSNGDTFTANGVTYTYDGNKWKTSIVSNDFFPNTGGTVSGNIVLDGELQHSGDTDTNIAFDTDTILFDTAGSERFRVGSAGQLGIGGATYGSDGQVLTSGGASAAPSWTTLNTSNLTRMTAAATTSGANVDFTIPSGVRKITLLLDEVSRTDDVLIRVQIGTGGSPLTSGYVGRCTYLSSSTGNQHNYSAGFDFRHYDDRFNLTGSMEICNIAGNTWISTHNAASTGWATNCYGAGVATLSGELDLVRLTASSGTFDNGQATIMYEV